MKTWLDFIGFFFVLFLLGFVLGTKYGRQQQNKLEQPAVSTIEEPHAELLNYVWERESSCGTDPKRLLQGPAGELGDYQITPIFVEDVKRLGYEVDRLDPESSRFAAMLWIDHYSKKIPDWESLPIETQYELYRRGYKGFKEKYNY